MNRRQFIEKLGSVSGLMAGMLILPKLLVKVPPDPTPPPSVTPTPEPIGVSAFNAPGSDKLFRRGDGTWQKLEYPKSKYEAAFDCGQETAWDPLIPYHGVQDPGHQHSVRTMGYGRCSVSGCNCPAFMGSDQLCQNCGHNYNLHW